jgi:hypothetical protein
VSRLGNPLFNEVIVPLGDKDRWNRLQPVHDKQFAHYVANPELASLLPVLYPGAFPHLAALNQAGTARADLEAILLTGIPAGLISGFTNFTGPVQADMLRLNTSIPPTPASSAVAKVADLSPDLPVEWARSRHRPPAQGGRCHAVQGPRRHRAHSGSTRRGGDGPCS